MRYQRHKLSGRSIKARFLAMLLMLIMLTAAVSLRIRPILKNLSEVQAAYISNQAIDQAAAEVLARDDISYDDFISLNLLEDGTVASMTSNIQSMNNFKTEIAAAVQEKLGEYQYRTVSIPIGTLTGIDLLSGRGPGLDIKIKLYSTVSAELESEFEGAGINQTRHRIICKVTVEISAILSWCSSYTTVEGSFAVSETILLGNVPDSYTSVDTTEDVYDDINNFLGD